MKYTLGFGSYFGIPVKIHITFPLILVIFGVEAWLRGGWQEGLWAVFLVLAVFICVVLHELGHSLQVRRFGVEVKDIVLLPIGGMARATAIPEKPAQEIAVAISGPMVNFALAALMLPFLLLRRGPIDFENDFLASLFSINLVLGTFNLIPAFPMDGGRVLRGLLATRMSYLRATHHAKNVGQAIAVIFVVLGFTFSNLLMLPFIAVVIFFGAMSEENMIKIKFHLKGKTVGDFIRRDIPLLLIEDGLGSAVPYLADRSLEVLPVTDTSCRLAALVRKEDIAGVLEASRCNAKLGEFLQTDFILMEASTPAIQAYHYLKSEKEEVAGVVEEGHFKGLVSLLDIARGVNRGSLDSSPQNGDFPAFPS